MKSEKGITLTSLIIYVIAMLIVITIITVITAYFYKNIDIEKDTSTYITEYSRLEGYLSKEVNKANNRVTAITAQESQASNSQIVFKLSDGNILDDSQYTYVKSNKAIYKNKIKIASNVEACTVQYDTTNNMLTMNLTIKGQSKILKYVFSA